MKYTSINEIFCQSTKLKCGSLFKMCYITQLGGSPGLLVITGHGIEAQYLM